MWAIWRISVTLTTLAFAGCAQTATPISGPMAWDNIRTVKLGTTEADLIAAMGGPPYLTKKTGNLETWVWTNPYAITGASMVSFGMRDGKVVEVPNLAGR